MPKKNEKKDGSIDTLLEKQSTEKSDKIKSVKSLMYIGPTLKKEIIAHGMVFNVPPDIDSLNQKYPGIRVFFIEIKDIAKTLPLLRKEGSELNIRYKQIKKTVNGGVK